MRVAILGAGLMGRWHAHAARRLGATVAAVFDPEAPRAEALAARHRSAVVHTDAGPVLGGLDVDAVHVCTPSETHRELIGAALEAGLHVLAEKPLADDAGATAELLRVADGAARLLVPVHQCPFQRGFRRLQAARSGIGDLLHLESRVCSAGARGDGAKLRDEIAADILPHPLSTFARLVARPLGDVDWSVRRPAAGELRALGRADSVSLSILVSMGGRPTANRLDVLATAGSARVDFFHGYAVLRGGAVSRSRKIAGPFLDTALEAWAAGWNLVRRTLRRETAFPGLRELVRAFYRAVESGGPPPVEPRETIEVARARDRILGAL